MRLLTLGRTFIAALTGLALLGGILAHAPTARADDWCWDDPVVSIKGVPMSIAIGVHAGPGVAAQIVQDATIVITVPQGVTTDVLSTQNSPFQESVLFLTGLQPRKPGTPQTITVAVLIRGTNPHEIATAVRISYKGHTRTDASTVVNSKISYTIEQLTL
jgi:hypothetical protein